jgi:hypothetical protein
MQPLAAAVTLVFAHCVDPSTCVLCVRAVGAATAVRALMVLGRGGCTPLVSDTALVALSPDSIAESVQGASAIKVMRRIFIP